MADKSVNLADSVKNSAVIKNPVLFEAIGIAPVVAMAVSLKTAVMLSVISTVELIIIESFACLCLKKLKHSFRVLVYAVLGVLINVPLFMLFNRLAPNETANVSIFLPVIAVNSLIALHCERVAVKNDFKTTFLDAVSASIGYVLIIFIIGIVRELLGSGTIYGYSLNLPVKFSGLLLPFGGFLLLGFIAAFFKYRIKKKYPDEKPESAFNLSEISQSHFEGIKSLTQQELNPFSDMFGSVTANETYENDLDFGGLPSETDDSQPKLFKTPRKDKAQKRKAAKENKKAKTEAKKAASPEAETSQETQPAAAKERTEYVSEFSEFDDILATLDAKQEQKQAEQDEAYKNLVEEIEKADAPEEAVESTNSEESVKSENETEGDEV